MKLKMITTILLLTLLTSIAVTAQPDNNLPTKTELTDFLRAVPLCSNYTTVVSDLAVIKHPSWKWDIWELNDNKTMVSFYYAKDSGYGAIYIYDNGTTVKSLCYLNNTLVKSYLGNTTVNVSKPNVTDESNCSVEIIKPNVTDAINCSVNISEPNLTNVSINVSEMNNTSVNNSCINETNNTTIGNNTSVKPAVGIIQQGFDISKLTYEETIKLIIKLIRSLSGK
jgi:hypothetical protein